MPVQRQAELHYKVCVPIVVPHQRFGRQLGVIYARLDETCGIVGWTTMPASGIATTESHSVSRYPPFAHVFVGRFCCGYWIGTIPVPSLCAATGSMRPGLHLSARPRFARL
jgi:hypothetical protein